MIVMRVRAGARHLCDRDGEVTLEINRPRLLIENNVAPMRYLCICFSLGGALLNGLDPLGLARHYVTVHGDAHRCQAVYLGLTASLAEAMRRRHFVFMLLQALFLVLLDLGDEVDLELLQLFQLALLFVLLL